MAAQDSTHHVSSASTHVAPSPIRRAGLDAASRLRAFAQERQRETPPRLVDLLEERRRQRSSASATPHGYDSAAPALVAASPDGAAPPPRAASEPPRVRHGQRHDPDTQRRHLERMARPTRQNADGYRVDDRGQVLPLLHRDEVNVLKPNTPTLGHGQIADCVDRLYRQSQLQQRAREQALAAKYVDVPVAAFLLGRAADSGDDGARPKSPTGVFTKLNDERQEGMVGRLYTAQVQRQIAQQRKRNDALAALREAKTRYRKLPAPADQVIERLFSAPMERKAAEAERLARKYAPPPATPKITRRPGNGKEAPTRDGGV